MKNYDFQSPIGEYGQMAEYGVTGNPKVAQVLQVFFQGNHGFVYRDGYIFEEALYLYGLSGDAPPAPRSIFGWMLPYP